MNNETPTFDTLPGMVYGLKQQVAELTTKIDSLLSVKPPAKPDERRIYGDIELAAYLGVTVQTVNRIKKAGKIPFYRIGRKYYYITSEIDRANIGKGQSEHAR